MTRATHQPVPRRRVLVGAAVALAVFAGIVVLVEGLRHPLPGGSTRADSAPAPDTDPRRALDCPDGQQNEHPDQRPEAILRAPAPPVNVTSGQLLDCPQTFARRTVRYQGEAVGGLLRRRDGAWVQLNDDAYAGPDGPLPANRAHRGDNTGIGVFLPAELADRISTVGGPQTRGDVVEVVGVFSRLHPATREVAVVHAETLEVLRPGGRVPDPPLRDRQVTAGILALLAAAAVTAERVVARRRARA